MRLLRYLREHTLVGGVVVLGATQFVASVVGLLRDRLLAVTFSSHLGVVDAYIAAFRPSDLLFQTTIISALGTVLVPVLAKYRSEGNNAEMSRVLNGTMVVAALVFGIIALILGIAFPWIAPGLVHFSGEQLQFYISFGRLALLINFLFVFGNATGQYLITVQRYWAYGITPILYTVGTIAGTVFLTPHFGAYGPIYGTLLGAVLYVIIRWIAVLRAGGFFGMTLWHADLPEMGKLMLPRILSLGAFQLQLLYLDRLASGFSEGSITINSYARNFESVLVGVVGIAVAQSVYSILSQAAARKERVRFDRYFRHGLWLCLGLTVPGAIALVLLAPFAAWLVHLTSVLREFTLMLTIYAISIPFESLSHLQLRAFYAMKDTLLPATFGVLGGGAAIAVSFLLAPKMGIYALAWGYTAGEFVQTAGLWVLQTWQEKRHFRVD